MMSRRDDRATTLGNSKVLASRVGAPKLEDPSASRAALEHDAFTAEISTQIQIIVYEEMRSNPTFPGR